MGCSGSKGSEAIQVRPESDLSEGGQVDVRRHSTLISVRDSWKGNPFDLGPVDRCDPHDANLKVSPSSDTMGDTMDEFKSSDDTDAIHERGGVTIGDNPDMGAIADRYTKIRKLGNGPFGEVVIAREKATGNEKAIKIIKKSLMMRSGGSSQVVDLLRELELVRGLDHPNIMGLYPLYQDRKNFYVVIDHYTGGDLLDLMCKRLRLEEPEAAFVFEQILVGLRYLHSKGVVHRDIKPENIYFDRPVDSREVMVPLARTKSDEETAKKKQVLRRSTVNVASTARNSADPAMVKIVDFGLACKLDRRYNEHSRFDLYPLEQRMGTSYYVAPEVLNKRYNEKCDMWSSGVLLYTMLNGYPPFNGANEDEIIGKIVIGKYRWYDLEKKVISKEARDLIQNLLAYHPDDRFSATEALMSGWISLFREPSQLMGGPHNGITQVLGNMKKFQASHKLARLSILFMGQMLTTIDDTRPLARAFVSLDENGDGRIDRFELYRALRLYDKDPLFVHRGIKKTPTVAELKILRPRMTTPEERERIEEETERRKRLPDDALLVDDEAHLEDRRWLLVDNVIESVDFDGNGFIEYSEFVTVALERTKLISDGTLQAAFNWIDLDGSGSIAADELKGMLPRVTSAEWLSILNDVDDNDDGEVDFEEFKVMMANFILE